MTDKRSDRHRQADTKYRANIALHGKNYWVKNQPLSYFADSGTGRGNIPALTAAKAGTPFSDPGAMQG